MLAPPPGTFAARIRDQRQALGISLRRIARELGVSISYLSHVELNQVRPPTACRIHDLARLLKLPEMELLHLAGREMEDLMTQIQSAPPEIPTLLRLLLPLPPRRLAQLIGRIRDLDRTGRGKPVDFPATKAANRRKQ